MKHPRTELCAQIEAQLPDYIDGEAKEEICRVIEKHLESCDNCRIVIDTLKKTISLYHNSPRTGVPGDVHRRLMSVLHLDQIEKPGK